MEFFGSILVIAGLGLFVWFIYEFYGTEFYNRNIELVSTFVIMIMYAGMSFVVMSINRVFAYICALISSVATGYLIFLTINMNM